MSAELRVSEWREWWLSAHVKYARVHCPIPATTQGYLYLSVQAWLSNWLLCHCLPPRIHLTLSTLVARSGASTPVSSHQPGLLRSTTHFTRLALQSSCRDRSTLFTPPSHQHGVLLFRNVALTPEQQYALTKVLPPYSGFPLFVNLPPSFRNSILNLRAMGMATTRLNPQRSPFFITSRPSLACPRFNSSATVL